MRTALLSLILFASTLVAFAQPARSRYTLLDVMVFGSHLDFDIERYPADVRADIHRYQQRARAYRPRPRPAKTGPEMKMVYAARENYERMLVAAAEPAGRVAQLAQSYVDALKPCYEWEGGHDCPERDALFAEPYLAAHRDSPFREFLPLLAAHRWLCTAEGYDYEKKPADAMRSRAAYTAALARAGRSGSILVRTAAGELRTRGRCHPD